MATDVGILTLKAMYNPSNIGEITSEVQADIDKIEKNLKPIETKLKAPNAKEFRKQFNDLSNQILKLQKGKLNGFNLSYLM